MVTRIVLIASFLVPLAGWAQDKGTYDFLRLEAGARIAALGGTSVSLTDDPNLLFSNPGTLATLSKPSASAGFLKHLLDVNSGNVVYGQSIGTAGTVAGGIMFIDYGSFDETDETMNVLGSFGARDLALVGGWGVALNERTSVGASLKFIYSSIASYSSSAAALDLGVLYRLVVQRITIGASLLNLGTQLIDNAIKFIFDCMNKTVFTDDKLVIGVFATKKWAEVGVKSSVSIKLRTIPQKQQQERSK